MKRNKRFHVLAFSLFLIISFSVSVYAITMDELEQNQSSIEDNMQYIEQQKAIQEEKKSQLQTEASQNSSNQERLERELELMIDRCQSEIDAINDFERSIQDAEKRIYVLEEKVKNRVKVLYENSDKSLVDILLSNESVADISVSMEIIRLASQKDKEMFDELEILKNDLAIKKQTQFQEYQIEKQRLIKKKEVLNEAINERAEIVRDIIETGNEISKLEDQEDYLIQQAKVLAEQIKILSSNKKYVGGELTWPLPCDYTIHSFFGMRLHPIFQVWKMHTGVDIGGPYGGAIVAANDGVVIISEYCQGYGNRVVIDHGGSISTLYAHCSSILVSVGDIVKKGEVIARVGETGYATGPHLHFEVIKNGTQVDPLDYFGNS